jgi:4-hydroxy-tetrahydrodipicolinate synthase
MMFQGSIVAIVTPMHADGSIAMDALHDLVAWHLEEGTQGIVVAGTTGESATLTAQEYRQVISAVVSEVAHQIPVIAGSGTNCTQKTIELTQEAKDLGVDACLLLTPYCTRPTQAGLLAHYQKVADNVAIPQILYNVPTRTACDLLPQTTIALAKHPNIVGIKECVSSHYAPLMTALGGQFDIFSGDDGSAGELLTLGGQGVISVVANVAPRLMRNWCDAFAQGDSATALALQQRLQGLNDTLFLESNPIPVKWALNQMGKIPPGIRLPLTPLSVQYQPLLQEALRGVL